MARTRENPEQSQRKGRDEGKIARSALHGSILPGRAAAPSLLRFHPQVAWRCIATCYDGLAIALRSAVVRRLLRPSGPDRVRKAGKRGRPDMARREARRIRHRGRVDPRLHGRAPPGGLLPGRAPIRSARMVILIAARRHDRVTAPRVQNGPVNGSALRGCVQEAPVPALLSGGIVIMDSPASHEAAGVCAAARAARAHRLHLQPGSPGKSLAGQVCTGPGQRIVDTITACIGGLPGSLLRQ